MTNSKAGILTIDKFYMCYQLAGCSDVQYVYSTLQDYREYVSDKRVIMTRVPSYRYPDEITKQMAMVRYACTYTKQPIWISDEIIYDEGGTKRWLARARRGDYDWKDANARLHERISHCASFIGNSEDAGGNAVSDSKRVDAAAERDQGSEDNERICHKMEDVKNG